MPECFGVPVVTMLVCFLSCIRDCGCGEHPAFPAPSLSRDSCSKRLGRDARRGNAMACHVVCGCAEATSSQAQAKRLFEIRIEWRAFPYTLPWRGRVDRECNERSGWGGLTIRSPHPSHISLRSCEPALHLLRRLQGASLTRSAPRPRVFGCPGCGRR
jgi:hypothetical protein